jgi:hypothetical protein
METFRQFAGKQRVLYRKQAQGVNLTERRDAFQTVPDALKRNKKYQPLQPSLTENIYL